MKATIKKIFSREELGSIAFFSTLLATLGSWCVAAWMTLGGVIFDFSGKFKVSPWFTGIAAVFALTALLCNLGFFYTQVPEKFKKWFLVSCLLLACAVGVSGLFFGINTACCIFIAAFLWILPLAVFRKYWYWVIPGSIFYTAAAIGLLTYCRYLWNLTVFIFTAYFDEIPLSLSYLSWCIWIAFIYNAGLYAAAQQKSLKKFFHPAIFVLIFFWLASYGVSFMAFSYSERRAAEEITKLEQYFGHTADSNGLSSIYYSKAKRPADYNFWAKLKILGAQYDDRLPPAFEAVSQTPCGQIPEQIRQEWKKFFFSSPERKEAEELFSKPLPTPLRKYNDTLLSAVSWDEMDRPTEWGMMHLWSLVFALEDKDPARARKAFDSMVKYKNILNCSTFWSIQHTGFLYSQIQGRGIEKMLSSGFLSEEEIRHYLHYFESERKQLPELERRSVFGDSVYSLNMCEYFNKSKHLLFPPVRYITQQLRTDIASSCRTDSLAEAEKKFASLKLKHLLRRICGFELGSEEFKSAQCRLLIFETLLKLELEKRKTGQYPDSAPEWLPADPLNGRKLNYRKGSIKIMSYVYDPQTQKFKPSVRTKKAAAVWSSGKDLSNTPEKDSEDLCAVIEL